MAEERVADRLDRSEDRPAETAPIAAPLVAKKNKKRGKGGLFFLLLVLIFGAGAGLHFSGKWDARPLVWEVVPRIPYIGKPIAGFFEIPEQYTLTAADRRAYELSERQKVLDERERSLRAMEGALTTASADVGAQKTRLDQLLTNTPPPTPQKNEAEDRDAQEVLDNERRDLSTMSARNAAAIVEKMMEGDAVNLLKGMSSDARASILAKMDPAKAARIMEIMSRP